MIEIPRNVKEVNPANCGVYTLMSPENKFYVGQTTDFPRREDELRGNNLEAQPKLHAALNRWPFAEWITTFTPYPVEELLQREGEAIVKHNSVDNGYNSLYGEGTGATHTDETKEKMRAAKIGIPKTVDEMERAAAGRALVKKLGRPLTREENIARRHARRARTKTKVM